MKWTMLGAVVVSAMVVNAHAESSSSSSSASSDGSSASVSSGPGKNCKTVYLKAGEKPPSGGMTSSVTAGDGKVSGFTTGAGGSVTTQTGSGTNASSMSSVTQDGRTVVTSSNGDCTIYVDPDKK
jgi:hypothetical protein